MDAEIYEVKRRTIEDSPYQAKITIERHIIYFANSVSPQSVSSITHMLVLQGIPEVLKFVTQKETSLENSAFALGKILLEQEKFPEATRINHAFAGQMLLNKIEQVNLILNTEAALRGSIHVKRSSLQRAVQALSSQI